MAEKEKQTYDQAAKELQQVVQELERGEGTLEDNLKLYKKGVSLCRLCQKQLDEAQLALEQADCEE